MEWSFFFISCNPPTSWKEIWGLSLMNSRVEVGSTVLNAARKYSAGTPRFAPPPRAGSRTPFDLDPGHEATQPRHACFRAEGGKIRPDVPVGDFRQTVQVDICRERHLAGMDLQDLEAVRPFRESARDLAIETSGAGESRVDQLRR